MEEGRRRKDTAPSLVAYLTEMIMEMTHGNKRQEKEKGEGIDFGDNFNNRYSNFEK